MGRFTIGFKENLIISSEAIDFGVPEEDPRELPIVDVLPFPDSQNEAQHPLLQSILDKVRARSLVRPTSWTAEGGSPDVVGMYIKEAARYPQLTKEQEQGLGHLMQAGSAAKEILADEEVTDEERRELGGDIIRAGLAKDLFINCNLRLAISIATKHSGNVKKLFEPNVPLADLIQVANIGLDYAVDHYDPDRDFKFSTNGTDWIRRELSRHTKTSDLIRLPVRAAERVNTARRALTVFEESGLSVDELSDELLAAIAYTSELKIKVGRRDSMVKVSEWLDASLRGEDSRIEPTLHDKVSDQGPEFEYEDVVERTALGGLIEAVKSVLSAEEIEYMKRRFDLDSKTGVGMTHEAIMDEMGLTRDAVRILEARAIAKLRHPIHGLTMGRYRSILDNNL